MNKTSDVFCSITDNTSRAMSLMESYNTVADEQKLSEAIAILDETAKTVRERIGEGWINNAPINAYAVSKAGYVLAQAYKLLSAIGTLKSEYINAATDVCNYAIGHQLIDGSITVEGYVTDGFDGVFFITALVSTYLETEINYFHVAAVRAFSYYYREFMNTDPKKSTDELILVNKALISGGQALYQYTGFEKYMEMIKQLEDFYDTYCKR